VPQIRIQPAGGALSREAMLGLKAASGRCRKEGNCPGGMSETRGLRSPYGGNREVARLGRVERPDIAITYPNFPLASAIARRLLVTSSARSDA
jgi:hypothetical protein